MLQYVAFGLYLLWLVIFVVLLAINTVRIGAATKANPRAVTLLLPLLINFITSNTLFKGVPPLLTTLLTFGFIFLAVRRLEKVRIFALTGATATGKSTLIKLITKNLKHLQVIDTDKILENELKKGRRGYKIVLSLFENKVDEFLDLETQEIEKQKFMDFLYQQKAHQQVFSSKVESIILWPIIKIILSNILSKKNLILIKAPLLYHFKLLRWIFFPKITLSPRDDLQLKRAQQKWNCNQKQVQERISMERSLAPTKTRGEIWIENNKSEEEFFSIFLTKIMPFMNKDLNHYSQVKKN